MTTSVVCFQIVFQSSMAANSTAFSHMTVNQSSVTLSPTSSLHVLSADTKRAILSLNSSYLQLSDLPSLSANLTSTRLTTNSVSCLHISQPNLFPQFVCNPLMIQVRNLNNIQSSGQLSVRGAAGVNIIGSFVNITAGGIATLRAGVRERDVKMIPIERDVVQFQCLCSVINPII